MLRFLSNIPISRRLFTLFFIAAAIPAIVIILLGNFYVSQLTTRSQAVQTSLDAQSLAAQEQSNLQRMNALVQTRFNQIFASLSGEITDPSLSHAAGLVSADIAAREADFGQGLATYQANYDLATSSNMNTIRSILINDNPEIGPAISTDQQSALHSVATSFWPQYLKLQKQEVALLDSLDPTAPNHLTTFPPDQLALKYNQAYSLLWQANFQFTDLSNTWQRVVDDTSAIGKIVTSVGPSVTQPVLIATAIAVIATFLIVFLTGWLVNLTITTPLRRLAMLTRHIGSGDTTARAKVFGRDEIALVANSMNGMLDNIVRLIQDAQASRDNLQRQVEKLVSEVSGVGEGDLRIQAEVTADALGVLADSFNYMVEELSSLVVSVKMVAHEVENSTTMTFERMTQLVESADNQINQIAGAAIEVEGMADSSRNVAERAQVLFGVALEARRTAESGRQAVQQTVEGMGRINAYVQDTSGKVQTLGERSREINNIVEVISSIAHQTNRLALDAAIQAAMAGENGKGFGAVAGDIRRLAERAKDEAGMIARIVRSVREDIGAAAVSMRDTERETSVGANLAQETGTSLESIFNVVERQGREIEIINQMATQQLQSSSSVVQIMHAVSDSTGQSSASTRQTAQNMERLARLAEQLLGSVEAFKLPDQTFDAAGRILVSPVVQDKQRPSSSSIRTVTASAHHPGGAGAYPALAPAGAYGRSYPTAPSYPAARQGNAWPPVAPPSQWQQQSPQPRGNGMPPQPPPVSSPLRRPPQRQHMDARKNGQ